MMQLDLFPTEIHLRCIDPTQKKRRYYAMFVQQNLFGEWELVREWGRIGGMGRIRCDRHPSSRLAFGALHDLAAQKAARGYVIAA